MCTSGSCAPEVEVRSIFALDNLISQAITGEKRG